MAAAFKSKADDVSADSRHCGMWSGTVGSFAKTQDAPRSSPTLCLFAASSSPAACRTLLTKGPFLSQPLTQHPEAPVFFHSVHWPGNAPADSSPRKPSSSLKTPPTPHIFWGAVPDPLTKFSEQSKTMMNPPPLFQSAFYHGRSAPSVGAATSFPTPKIATGLRTF